MNRLLSHYALALEGDVLEELHRHQITPDEVPALIEDYARLGSGNTFPGFGTDTNINREMVQSLAAIRAMLHSHHDEPWGNDE